MRASSLLAGLALAGLAACDDPPPAPKPAASESPAASAAVAASAPAPSATAAVIPTQPMPPRPVPLGSSGPIQPSAPAEQQMMAITYTLAMVSPRGTDPLVDKAWIDDMTKKFEVAVRAADKGKTPANPIRVTKGKRKIEVQMGKGCTDRVPLGLVMGRGSSLKEAFNAGVLVISCHDDKWECHQSTRDQADVLCHAAPRR